MTPRPKIISHRGNLNGPRSVWENSEFAIREALSKGFDVEIDVSYPNGTFLLGHDDCLLTTSESFLRRRGLWIHCKDFESFYAFSCDKFAAGRNFFFHTTERFVLTSMGYLWHHSEFPKFYSGKSVRVDPSARELHAGDNTIFGLCTDYAGELA